MTQTEKTLHKLSALYDEYLREMSQAERERLSLRGALGSIMGGAGAGADSCNDRFAEGVRQTLADLANAGPSSDDILAVMRWVLAQKDRPCGNAAKWMLQAADGLLLPLAGLLAPADASALLAEYTAAAQGAPLLPVQQKLRNTLRERTGGDDIGK